MKYFSLLQSVKPDSDHENEQTKQAYNTTERARERERERQREQEKEMINTESEWLYKTDDSEQINQ